MADQLDSITAAIAVPPYLGDKLRLAGDEAGTRSSALMTVSPIDPLDFQAGQETSIVLESKNKMTIRRSAKALRAYLKTPVGVLVGIYGSLVVVWGAGLVIILAGWTPMSKNTRDIWVEVCSQASIWVQSTKLIQNLMLMDLHFKVLNGLFTVTGVGFIPWRLRDAWHMSVITRYRRKIAKLDRRSRRAHSVVHPPGSDQSGLSYLSEKEKLYLETSEGKFTLSQPWYRPRATSTHEVRICQTIS